MQEIYKNIFKKISKLEKKYLKLKESVDSGGGTEPIEQNIGRKEKKYPLEKHSAITSLLNINGIIAKEKDIKWLGSGTFGAAFSIGNNTVVKFSQDVSEINNMDKLKTHPHKNLVEIKDVFSVPEGNVLKINKDIATTHSVDEFGEIEGIPISRVKGIIIMEQLVPINENSLNNILNICHALFKKNIKLTKLESNNFLFRYYDEIEVLKDIVNYRIENKKYKTASTNTTMNVEDVVKMIFENIFYDKKEKTFIINLNKDFETDWEKTAKFRMKNKTANDLKHSLLENLMSQTKPGEYIDLYKFEPFAGYFDCLKHINNLGIGFYDVNKDNIMFSSENKKILKFVDIGASKVRDKISGNIKNMKLEYYKHYISKRISEIADKKLKELSLFPSQVLGRFNSDGSDSGMRGQQDSGLSKAGVVRSKLRAKKSDAEDTERKKLKDKNEQ